MAVTLKRGLLAGQPARIVAIGEEIQTLGEADRLIEIVVADVRLTVCASELEPIGSVEFAA